MKEKAYYLSINGKYNLFIYEHIPKYSNQILVLFLNPVFDEKKRVHRFQANTARALCSKGYHIIRFDYYGTGDSSGYSYEFSIEQNYNDIIYLIEHYKIRYSIKEFYLLGIRLGADLAIKLAMENEFLKTIILIEPIVSGKKYVRYLFLKRQAFYKLNKTSTKDEYITINNKKYLDHQGYPISELFKNTLDNLDLNHIELTNRNIFLFRVDNIYSDKEVLNLKTKLMESNSLTYYYTKCIDFWASKELVDTSSLTNIIIKSILEINQ